MDVKSNIIQFPLHKVKGGNKMGKLLAERNRIILTTSIASILVVMIFANIMFYRSNSYIGGAQRGIASIETQEENNQWDVELANRLAGVSTEREDSATAHKASLEDRIRFEVLEGRYALDFSVEGKLQSIEFAVDDKNAEPKFVKNRKTFLDQIRPLLAKSYDHIQIETLAAVKLPKGQLSEGYVLKSKDGQNLAHVQFRLDQYQRLLSMKISDQEIAGIEKNKTIPGRKKLQ